MRSGGCPSIAMSNKLVSIQTLLTYCLECPKDLKYLNPYIHFMDRTCVKIKRQITHDPEQEIARKRRVIEAVSAFPNRKEAIGRCGPEGLLC